MAGRPAFKPTPAQRRKVAAAAGAGMPQEQIALALGITKPTLAKHFEHELSTGAAVKRLETYDALHLQVRRGNVAAIKAYLVLSAMPMPEAGKGEGAAPAPEPKSPKLGKKEVAQLAAESASTGRFGARPVPLKVVGSK